MRTISSGGRAVSLFAAVALLVCVPLAAAAQNPPPCHVAKDIIRLSNPLARVARKLVQKQHITVVAIGSSSTAGAGASSKAANYPSRLEAELNQQFAGRPFTVINQGVGGEEVKDMLKRFDAGVVANHPDLVLWQLGTNSVLRDHPLGDHGDAIRVGLAKIRATDADVVLIDPQYTPKVISKPELRPMLNLISLVAKEQNVDHFHRYEMMKSWYDDEHLGFDTFASADKLHMNDWSYACMAKNLASAIKQAVERPVLSAKAGAAALHPDVP